MRFVGGNYIYPGLYDQLKFPLAYQDQWTLNYRQDVDFELTVATFGLNQTPGKNARYFTQVREVVGEGTVRIPDINGTPSQPFDALLIKVLRTAIDSTFLGGSPAPDPLLTTFGLTQGSVASDSFYVMYAPGFGGTVLSMNMDPGNQVSALFYRPAAARLGSQSTSVEDLIKTNVTSAPNPVKAGSYVYINTQIPVSVNSVQVFSLTGQMIYEKRQDLQTESNFSVLIPENTQAGIYFVNLKDSEGKIIGSRKIHVNQ